jgi:hypothetical protein
MGSCFEVCALSFVLCVLHFVLCTLSFVLCDPCVLCLGLQNKVQSAKYKVQSSKYNDWARWLTCILQRLQSLLTFAAGDYRI